MTESLQLPSSPHQGQMESLPSQPRSTSAAVLPQLPLPLPWAFSSSIAAACASVSLFVLSYFESAAAPTPNHSKWLKYSHQTNRHSAANPLRSDESSLSSLCVCLRPSGTWLHAPSSTPWGSACTRNIDSRIDLYVQLKEIDEMLHFPGILIWRNVTFPREINLTKCYISQGN